MTPRPRAEPPHARRTYGTIERTSLRGVLVRAAAGIGKKKLQRRRRVTFMLAERSSLFSSLSPREALSDAFGPVPCIDVSHVQ